MVPLQHEPASELLAEAAACKAEAIAVKRGRKEATKQTGRGLKAERKQRVAVSALASR